MIQARLKTTGLDDMLKVHTEAVKEVKAIAKEVALETAKAQELAILSGAAPDGSTQAQNKASTIARKRAEKVAHVKPLYRTGRLADSKAWKAGKTKRGATLRPPADRTTAVIVLQSRGYKTVLNTELPKEIVDLAEAKLDDLARKLT